MGLRVLAVDDDTISRALLRAMLEEGGHSLVAEAGNFEDALAAYRESRPDLVTLDLSLPATDGFEILKAILELDRTARVVIVSGNPDRKVREKVAEAGAAGFLSKPFDESEFSSLMARFSKPG
ncbi:MAG: response regulator [Elusimicrobia bacterium]|nr:response regulator [Elusimicrobiota bacterium]